MEVGESTVFTKMNPQILLRVRLDDSQGGCFAAVCGDQFRVGTAVGEGGSGEVGRQEGECHW